MSRISTDELFTGVKRETYESIRHELKKDQITGEALELMKKFISENLIAPTYREMMKSKEYQGVYEKKLL